ncbi:helix-turn-helix domain-containing protein [Parvicella tangerina]|uniref:DNA primase n=1 Tax=Parvicella tangerina TaxID=2829795 RepID=A0A916JNP6_9FLAO|nr:helix-turn-helix domain-containing protein [Parvicella tangerina]CAG5081259.1 hypothetical protein CRYO30217_01576 [Parvicella tangerina]
MNDKNILEDLFTYFRNGLFAGKANAAQKFLHQTGISPTDVHIGFNSGQFHHGKSEEFRKPFIEAGILIPSNAPVNSPDRVAYGTFGKEAIVFPLRDQFNQIVNFYAYRIKLKTPKGEYLNEAGLYPKYPKSNTQKLYLVHNELEAATLIQSDVMDNRETVIALRNGELPTELRSVLQNLTELIQIIVVGSISPNAKQQLNELTEKAIYLDLPNNHTLNDMWLNYGAEGMSEFLESTQPEQTPDAERTGFSAPKVGLIIHNPRKLSYKGNAAYYSVLGSLPNDLGSMKVSLLVEDYQTGKKHRQKLELFSTMDLEEFAQRIGEKESLNANEMVMDLSTLSDLLEAHREEQIAIMFPSQGQQKQKQPLSKDLQAEAMEFLQQKGLLTNIDKLLEQSGIVGEHNTRMILFVIASTYKMPYNLHALVQASSGSGKSHLINSIMECIPKHEVMNMTRVTSKSFYHYTNNELIDKLIVIQDFDGLDEEAQFAFREMQSAKYLSSSTTQKDQFGNLQSYIRTVKAQFASIAATTRMDIYKDNESRSIVIGIDESMEQTQNIIDYQNRKLAGLIDAEKEEQNKVFLRACVELLKPSEVINRFADKIALPMDAKMLRRLNSQFQSFVAQITILNQYQRQRDEQNRLITTPEDVRQAIDIFFDAIVLKVDELNSSTRQFYEELRDYLNETKPQRGEFSQRTIREALKMGKTSVAAYIKELIELEYIRVSNGSANRGFRYQLTEDDKMKQKRIAIKEDLYGQLDKISNSKM